MKLQVSRMKLFLAISLVFVCTPAHADDDDDPVMMAQLAEAKPVCEKLHAENKRKEKELEAALANTSLPPEKKQEVEEKIEKVKAVNAKMDEFLAQPLPAKREDREAYLRQASTFPFRAGPG